MRVGYRLKMIREQRIGLLFLLVLIIGIEIFIHRNALFFGQVKKESLPVNIQNIINYEAETDSKSVLISYFNPNTYTEADWQKIGFSAKQAGIILKYKKTVGGEFTSKEQLKKCFVISDDKYKELYPFIQLPEKSSTNNITQSFASSLAKSYMLTKFNPNTYTEADWQKIGFSVKQAGIILKYKKTVGGEFTSKEQLKKCFVISDDKYKELYPFIQLSEKGSKNDVNQSSASSSAKGYLLTKFNPNSYAEEDWQKIGFSQKQSKVIIKYRNKLGGSFTSKQQIKECFVISEYKFNEIEPYIQFQ